LKAQREKSSEADLANTRNLLANVELGNSNLQKSNSQEKSKRDASKPLYLVRYE
jgi:hypothetical protein